MRARVVGTSLVIALSGACDVHELSVDAASLRQQHNNAPQNNNASLNGFSLNGFSLNGFSLNGFSLNGFSLNGFSLNGVALAGTLFTGTQTIDGIEYPRSGTDFIGAEMRIEHEGIVYTLTFDDIYVDPSNPGGDVYFYDISVYDPTDQSTSPLCTLGGQPAAAIPLNHHWDPANGDRVYNPDAVTLACRGAVIAKCVEWGYRPWATATRCDSQGQNCEQISLTDHHQACTRMARADYCGDGKPHTVNGTLIDVYDRLSPAIQQQMTAGHPSWGVEAEWSTKGAKCVGTALRMYLLDQLEIEYDYPTCLDELPEVEDCGEFPVDRPTSLVGNSYCPTWITDPASCQ